MYFLMFFLICYEVDSTLINPLCEGGLPNIQIWRIAHCSLVWPHWVSRYMDVSASSNFWLLLETGIPPKKRISASSFLWQPERQAITKKNLRGLRNSQGNQSESISKSNPSFWPFFTRDNTYTPECFNIPHLSFNLCLPNRFTELNLNFALCVIQVTQMICRARNYN